MAKYKNKYRIESARLQSWDYGANGAYFITICTKNRAHFFGNISDGHLKLSAMGHIANSCWYEIPNHFPFVELGAHVIMPNHVHGIVIINKTDTDGGGVQTQNFASHDEQTQNFASLPQTKPPTPKNPPPTPNPPPTAQKPKNQFGPQSKNLASIVRGYKVGVTTNARQIDPDFAWQARYWDHIVRNEKEFQRITQYIINNPQKWEDDKLNGGKGNVVMEPSAEYNKQDWMI